MSVSWEYCSQYGLDEGQNFRRRGTKSDGTTYPCPPTGTVRQISLNVAIYLGFRLEKHQKAFGGRASPSYAGELERFCDNSQPVII